MPGINNIARPARVNPEVYINITKEMLMKIKEDKKNKVTSISSSSTDDEYPSAKCVYDAIGTLPTQAEINEVINEIEL